jgi:hypothetical protein
MIRTLFLLALSATNCLAHPGHVAPAGHLHPWDWWHLILGIALVAVSLAIWRVK